MPDTMTAHPAAPPSALTLETASQAKSLDDLAGVAAGMEAPAAGGAPAPGGQLAPAANPLAMSNAGVIEGAVSLGVKAFCDFTQLQSPRLILTEKAVREQAEGWGTWCAVRSIDLKTYMGRHADTIPLALATAMLALAVVQATRQEIAQRKPIEAEPKHQEGGAG